MVLATSKGWVIAATIKPEVLPATRLVELETDCFVPVGILKGCKLLGVGLRKISWSPFHCMEGGQRAESTIKLVQLGW
jgi:hypothetical protein